MGKETLVFKTKYTDQGDTPDINLVYDLKVWKPGIFRYLPPNKDYKYFMYWLFHYLRIFKNKSYSAYLLYNNDELVSSFLIVPSHFKWPFMQNNDVQFTYVMTNGKYRGKGVAGKLIEKTITDLNQSVDAFWYVTDTENIASIKVAEKIGFQCEGTAERRGLLNILRLKSGKDARLKIDN